MSSRILPSTPTEQLSCYQAFPHSLGLNGTFSFSPGSPAQLFALPNPQVLSLHRLAASLPSFQDPRSFFSITCSLFSQKHPGGGRIAASRAATFGPEP